MRKYPINPDITNDRRWDPNRRTICEVLRELYRDARERGDAVAMDRCDEAHDMAKRMAHKLEWYKENDVPKKFQHNLPEIVAGVRQPLRQAIKDASSKVPPHAPILGLLKWCSKHLDEEEYSQIQRDFIDKAPDRDVKFLAFDYYIRKKWRQACLAELQDGGMEVLSIGCGAAHELLCAGYMGNQCLGLDRPMDEPSVFDALCEFFGVSKVDFEVVAQKPLPFRTRSFDRVLGLSMVLDAEAGWSKDDWDFFLNDVYGLLKPGGFFFVTLTGDPNRSPELWEHLRAKAKDNRAHIFKFAP